MLTLIFLNLSKIKNRETTTEPATFDNCHKQLVIFPEKFPSLLIIPRINLYICKHTAFV